MSSAMPNATAEYLRGAQGDDSCDEDSDSTLNRSGGELELAMLGAGNLQYHDLKLDFDGGEEYSSMVHNHSDNDFPTSLLQKRRSGSHTPQNAQNDSCPLGERLHANMLSPGESMGPDFAFVARDEPQFTDSPAVNQTRWSDSSEQASQRQSDPFESFDAGISPFNKRPSPGGQSALDPRCREDGNENTASWVQRKGAKVRGCLLDTDGVHILGASGSDANDAALLSSLSQVPSAGPARKKLKKQAVRASSSDFPAARRSDRETRKPVQYLPEEPNLRSSTPRTPKQPVGTAAFNTPGHSSSSASSSGKAKRGREKALWVSEIDQRAAKSTVAASKELDCCSKQRAPALQPTSAAAGKKKTAKKVTVAKTEIELEEDALREEYKAKGLRVLFGLNFSVVNKKIDVFMKQKSGFTRDKLIQGLGLGTKVLKRHTVSIECTKKNGEGKKKQSKTIFGAPITLHLWVKARGGKVLNDKIVLRLYKEKLDGEGNQAKAYLIQVNAGGNWTDDDEMASLLEDVFGAFSPSDVKVRTDSSVYSVTNRKAFGEDVQVDIASLLTKLQTSGGYPSAKYLEVTGGLTFELKNPKCKPQVQKTGTVYLPFCIDPRRANLEVLKILLRYPELITRKNDSPAKNPSHGGTVGRPRKAAQASPPAATESKKRKRAPRGSVAATMLEEPAHDLIPDDDWDPNGEAVGCSVVRHPDGFSPRLRSSQPAPLPDSFLPGAKDGWISTGQLP